MRLFIQKCRFEVSLWTTKTALSKIDSIFTYPMLVSLEFERDWYWKQYLKGISVNNSVIKKQNKIVKKLSLAFKTTPLSIRYDKFVNYYELVKEKQREKEETLKDFKKYFPDED